MSNGSLELRKTKNPPDPKQLTTGYILSLVSAVLVMLQGIVRVLWGRYAFFLGIGELRRHSLAHFSFTVLGAVTVVLGLVILVGAILIPRGFAKEGAITVIAFSVLSIFTGGGFIAGLVLGVIGGAIVMSKIQPA